MPEPDDVNAAIERALEVAGPNTLKRIWASADAFWKKLSGRRQDYAPSLQETAAIRAGAFDAWTSGGWTFCGWVLQVEHPARGVLQAIARQVS